MLLSTSTAFGLDYKAVVVAPDATVRQDKAFDSKEVDKLNMGAKVTVKETLDNWYLVEASDTRNGGWVSSQEIVISDSSFRESNLKKGHVTTDVLNVRLGPSTDTNRITQIRRGDTVTIINTSNTAEKWYEVILSNNAKGWVHSDYIKITYKYPKGSVNLDGTALRQEPNRGLTHLAKLKKDDVVYIKDYKEGWYNVITSADVEGWVEDKQVKVSLDNVNNVSRSGSNREIFNNVDTITSKYLGKAYVYGGNGPNGFDCSGFTSYILKTYYGDYLKSKGINLPRTASTQAAVGTPVSRQNLEKGDLVFFDTAGRIGDSIDHVGIYIGNGQVAHASTSRRRIVIDNLSDRYYSTRFMKATRL